MVIAEPARRVAHVDIDAFFAAVEQEKDPRLRGRPVVVGTGVIASCSYEARRHGLRAGMALGEARRRCPTAVILRGHAPTYRAFADRVFGALAELAPAVDRYLDDAYLDLSGTERLYPDLTTFAVELRARVRAASGLAVTVGMGSNRMVARLASQSAKPDGFAIVPPGTEAAFVRDRPLRDLPGIGPRTAGVLESLGLATVAEVAALGADALARRLGPHGRVLYERALGRDPRPVSPREIPTSISRTTSFDPPAIDPAAIAGHAAYLIERAAREARRLGVAARFLGVTVEPADGRREERRHRFPAPTALDPVLYAVARDLIARAAERRVGLRRLGIELSGLVLGAAVQLDLLAGAEGDERDRRLAAGIDQVRDRFGHAALIGGRTFPLATTIARDRHGFVLRTPSLTK
jgi:DNA polymerase-4